MYGVKDLEPQYKEKVRQHTLCALRAVDAAQAFLSLTAYGDAPLPWTIETPKMEKGLALPPQAPRGRSSFERLEG